MVNEIKTIEDRKKSLIKKGKANGYVTYEEMAEELKGLEVDSDTLDDLYNTLVENHIEIISETTDNSEDDNDENPSDLVVEDLTLSKDIKINDPVRMYLKEIGRINLLTSDEEFEYARLAEQGDEHAKKMLQPGPAGNTDERKAPTRNEMVGEAQCLKRALTNDCN